MVISNFIRPQQASTFRLSGRTTPNPVENKIEPKKEAENGELLEILRGKKAPTTSKLRKLLKKYIEEKQQEDEEELFL